MIKTWFCGASAYHSLCATHEGNTKRSRAKEVNLTRNRLVFDGYFMHRQSSVGSKGTLKR
jgi:hypothetical protein